MKKSITIFPNGVVAKLHNRRVIIETIEGGVYLKFSTFDKNPGKACHHEHLKGCIRNTRVKLSDEAIEALVESYIAYKEYKKHGKASSAVIYTWQPTH